MLGIVSEDLAASLTVEAAAKQNLTMRIGVGVRFFNTEEMLQAEGSILVAFEICIKSNQYLMLASCRNESLEGREVMMKDVNNS